MGDAPTIQDELSKEQLAVLHRRDQIEFQDHVIKFMNQLSDGEELDKAQQVLVVGMLSLTLLPETQMRFLTERLEKQKEKY